MNMMFSELQQHFQSYFSLIKSDNHVQNQMAC